MDDRIAAWITRLQKRPELTEALSLLKKGKSVVFDSLSGGGYAMLAAALAQGRRGLFLVIAAKPGDAERIPADLSFFTDIPVDYFPMLPDTIIEEGTEFFHHEDVDFGHRLRCLKLLAEEAKKEKGAKSSLKQGRVLVTSLSALLQPVPTPDEIETNTIFLRRGDEYPPEKIIQWMLAAGFQSANIVELPGEYSYRGNILDIFAGDWQEPVRLEFFGDEIESIRTFDPAIQCSTGNLDEIDLSRLGRNSRSEGSLIDHLPSDTTIFLIDTDQIIQEIQNLIQYDRYPSKKKGENQTEEEVPSVSSVMNSLYRFSTVHAVAFSSGSEMADASFSLRLRSVDRFCGNMQEVFGNSSLYMETQGSEIFLIGQTESETKRLSESLAITLFGQNNRLTYMTGDLTNGFEWPDESLILLSSNQMFGRLAVKRPQRRKLSKTIDSFLELMPGDLVIHVGYGLARFRGLKTIKKAQLEEEHLELEFADKVTLYVPVSRISLVQKYIGTGKGSPRLAKINGTTWAKQKKAVQGAVLNLAMEMLDLQAAREALTGNVFPPDSEWQLEFEGIFPYQATNDQLLAIEAIKSDMERPQPMDRLLCGDVGFGKTEVALRAAFKAVDAGYQVAVLVPTTVLAEQHFRVFQERLATFPMSVKVLSRFTSAKESRLIKESLKDGSLDIVIGTHGLTRSEIEFANLGLVVIDEEQKFGVSDKEQLKKVRQLVDVLTMTATPIPRTLHFSLLGLRDISNLETPPSNRLPVETRVIRFDTDVIRKAVLREIQRQGQVYYVHNRVSDIEEVALKLRQVVPEARIVVAHAQMPDEQLEVVMRDFVLGKYDVLVCTTIIESGLDIPTANTIFIDRADRFGLAELHQLRGRVGRDKYQAYCYLLLDQHQFLTPNSSKRLQAIEEYSHLGAGFHIAMRDLEIRGAGNILGTQQSGHIAMVGYEMYCDFLDSAVRMLKKMPQKTVVDVEVDLPGRALVPKGYIEDQRSKIDVYRRMLRVTTPEECDDMENELRDRFGPVIPEVAHLLMCARIRVYAWKYRVFAIQLTEETGTWYLTLSFHHENLMYKLRDKLAKWNVPLRITEGLMGHVPLPPFVFHKNGGVDPDELTPFVLRLFSEGEVPQ